MNNIWLIGVGSMGLEYSKVLNGMNLEYIAIGRGEKSAANFEKERGKKVIRKGLYSYLDSQKHIPEFAIVSVGVEELKNTTVSLLNFGVKNILVEKPAGLIFEEISAVEELAKVKKANVFVAYNRRFYASVINAEQLIKKDGGVSSFNFEFTEWAHVVEKIEKAAGVKENWLLGNSSHVIDMAFSLCGYPVEMASYKTGRLTWHPSGAVYTGAGKADNNVLFTYQANWKAPGRWSVEVLTEKHRYIFRPLEKIQVQNLGEINYDFIEIDDSLDLKYKPGLFLQVQSFLSNQHERLVKIGDHKQNSKVFEVIKNGGRYSV